MPYFSWFDRRWSALVVLCTGMLMIVLDNTVVNVALASIQHDLGFSDANLAWPVNAYMIAFGGSLLLAGRLGDFIGAKPVLTAGLLLFTLASLLCGLSTSQWMLIAARFVQGLGGAMAAAVALAMIFTSFTEKNERAKALSVFNFTASAGGSVGLLIGGILTQLLNWHWIFLVNVPIGIATYFFARRIIPDEPRAASSERADVLGAALLIASLMLGVYTVVQIPQSGLSLQLSIAALMSITLMCSFLIRQATIERPLLPLRVFAKPNVISSNVAQALIVTGLFAFFFLYSLYLRGSLHYDAVATGIAFLPITIAIGGLSLGPSAWLMQRLGSRPPLVVGLVMSAAALAIFALASPQASYALVIIPAMTLMGIGMGIAFPCLMEFAMSSATPEDSGLISGLANTSAEAGGALGLAVLATTAAAFGYHTAFAIGTLCLLASAVIAAFALQTPRREVAMPAERRGLAR